MDQTGRAAVAAAEVLLEEVGAPGEGGVEGLQAAQEERVRGEEEV